MVRATRLRPRCYCARGFSRSVAVGTQQTASHSKQAAAPRLQARRARATSTASCHCRGTCRMAARASVHQARDAALPLETWRRAPHSAACQRARTAGQWSGGRLSHSTWAPHRNHSRAVRMGLMPTERHSCIYCAPEFRPGRRCIRRETPRCRWLCGATRSTRPRARMAAQESGGRTPHGHPAGPTTARFQWTTCPLRDIRWPLHVPCIYCAPGLGRIQPTSRSLVATGPSPAEGIGTVWTAQDLCDADGCVSTSAMRGVADPAVVGDSRGKGPSGDTSHVCSPYSGPACHAAVFHNCAFLILQGSKGAWSGFGGGLQLVLRQRIWVSKPRACT